MAAFTQRFYPKRFTRFLPLIHPVTHTLTHQWQQATTQGAGQPLGAIWGLAQGHFDTGTGGGGDRTGL